MKPILLPYAAIHSGPLVLVNSEHPIASNQESPALVSLGGECSNVLLERMVIPPFTRLMNAIGGWTDIRIVSGWRSKKEQQEIYERSFTENGAAFTERFVALPDHSEHQTGFAVDLGIRKPDLDFICPDFPDSGVCGAFRKKAATYGFIERYPKNKESVTRIVHEPWHFRYVGVPHAAIMSQLSLSLEEYIDYIRQFPIGGESLPFTLNQGMIAIYYRKAERNAPTSIEIDPRFPYSISGNNVDGFVLTEWRISHDRR